MGDVFDQATQQSGDVFDQAAAGASSVAPEGFLGSLGSDLWNTGKGLVKAVTSGPAARAVVTGGLSIPYDAINQVRQQAPEVAQSNADRKAAGNSLSYRVAAGTAETLGANVKGMENAATQGDVGGVLGHAAAPLVTLAATEGVSKAIPKIGSAPGVKQIRELYKPLADINEGVVDTRQGQFSPLPGPKNPNTVQPIVQQGIRDVVSDVAKDAGVAPSKASSIRDVVGETAENVKAKSQPIFQKLDELSKGQFSDAQAAAKRYRGAIDKAGKDAYAEAVAKQDKIFDTFKDQFNDQAFIKAKADWRQYRALQDVDEAIKSSTVGQRPSISQKATGPQPLEQVKAAQLSTRLHSLYNDGTLETALGKQAADDLLTHVGSAEKQIELINQGNRDMIAANRARNAHIREQNEATNAATIAKNKAANEAVMQKRRIVSRAVLGGAGAAAGYYVKGKLSGGQ